MTLDTTVPTPLIEANGEKAQGSATVIYGKGSFPSGQRLASEMLIVGLQARGWSINVITTPLQDRTGSSSRLLGYVSLLFHLLWVWIQALVAAVEQRSLVVNLGQTRFAMIRDGFPLLVHTILRRRDNAIVSLHGNLFTGWDPTSSQARLLRRLTQPARYVTVLGEHQRACLVAMDVPAEKIVHVDNTCTMDAITQDACDAKQIEANGNRMRVLFLSNLLESKGYPEFVRGIERLAESTDLPIDATLCGRFIDVDTNRQFESLNQAQAWLEATVQQINRSSTVHLEWIPGAFGVEKIDLFLKAHIFVLPSHYKVEAQPIVLLEALAGGCAIVTTRVGEIPSTVSPESAIRLDGGTPDQIANAIKELVENPRQRQKLATNGLHLFNERFSYEKHIDRWESLLHSLT